jgi:hypothetical protein
MKQFNPAFQALTSSSVLVALICWALWAVGTDLWPSSRWLEVDSVVVVSGKAGEPLAMEVDREVKDDFTATWSASVRSIDGHVVCSGSATSNYRHGANLPPDTTLAWWTNGGCNSLPAGRYYLATDWRIHAHSIWPEKVVSIDSPMFEVTP